MQIVLSTLLAQALAHAPEVILFVVTTILLPFAVKWIRAKASTAELEMIATGADVAYNVVESIARKTPGKLDDKAAIALRVFRDDLRMRVTKKNEPKFKAVIDAKHEAVKRAAAGVPLVSAPGARSSVAVPVNVRPPGLG